MSGKMAEHSEETGPRPGPLPEAGEGEEGVWIVAACNRRVQKVRPKRKRFTRAAGERFLGRLAMSCNVALAARECGLSPSTLYDRRKRDAEFRAGWEEAIRQGYARLEAELLKSAIASVSGEPRDYAVAPEGPEPVVAPMDPQAAMQLLRLHRQTGSSGGGGSWLSPLPVTDHGIETARARLEAKMRKLGIIEGD